MRTATGEQEQSERKKTCLQFTRVKHEPESVLIKSRRERDGKDNNNQRTVWEKKKLYTLCLANWNYFVCASGEKKNTCDIRACTHNKLTWNHRSSWNSISNTFLSVLQNKKKERKKEIYIMEYNSPASTTLFFCWFCVLLMRTALLSFTPNKFPDNPFPFPTFCHSEWISKGVEEKVLFFFYSCSPISFQFFLVVGVVVGASRTNASH